MDIQELHLVATRCIGECNVVVVEEETEETVRNWSDASNWPNEVVPQEGDDVEIPSGWNMTFDIAETPILNSLTINGYLFFSDDQD